MDLRIFEEIGFYDPAAPNAADVRGTLEYLGALGVDARTIVEAIDGNWLHSAGLDLILARGDLSPAELAGRSGVDLDTVLETYRLLGVALPSPESRFLLEDEVDLFEVLAVTELLFEEGEGDEVLRSTSAAMTTIAEAMVSIFVGGVEDRIESAATMSLRERTELSQVTGESAMTFGRALGPLFRHHLRQAIIRQRSSMLTASDRRLRTMTIGFVDLVGFTPLSASMSASELEAFIRDFEARSYDVASRAGGRIVKTIGDEVMVSALDVDTGCEILVGLIEEFRTADAIPRGGLAAGEVLARFGDFFGPVVNLASRLVDQAVPGEILADAAGVGQLHGDRFACEPAGRRMLKGFADPVAVVSILRR